MLNDLSDELLLARYVDGDVEAFPALYGRHKGAIFRYLLRQTQDPTLAEDLLQDVWGSVIIHASAFERHAKFTTWLYTIARNKVIDHVRHLKVSTSVIESSDSAELENALRVESNEVEAQLVNRRRSDALQHCLKGLPLHLLDVFVLKEEANMTATQIAEVVKASHEATKSRLRYAYKQLAACLRPRLAIGENQVLYNE